ncbi:hypothetical protein BKA93DRAFT_904453 [Sparassis latifolia]|uniref:Uncharacterized protein n=1 Tax=Sparassis crispa TaxID=139825 RepID=A0A401GZX9_9APHY|nr:hypothetical protein SCP_1103950 [Sparassis crispa]GBE87718.1 hypothetical protein SCP_1103950 [Sparassis crispa]
MSTLSDTRRHTKPCRLYAQGHCRFGASCKFNHELASQVTTHGTPASQSETLNYPVHTQRAPRVRTKRKSSARPQPPATDDEQPSPVTLGSLQYQSRPSPPIAESSSSTNTNPTVLAGNPRPKRGEIPCHAWKTGSCTKGAKCWFGHDPEVQEAARIRAEQALERARQEVAQHARQVQEEAERQARLAQEEAERQVRLVQEEAERLAQERAREEHERARRARLAEREAARERERQARTAELAKEDAAKTIQHVVLGSIVTFSAGLSVDKIITGFESCTVRTKNLPLDAREDEVRALFTQQGIDAGRFHIVSLKRTPDGKQEAVVVMEAESGSALAAGLDGLEFREETLVFEVGSHNIPGSMNSATGRDADVLTISWRAPSARYVVEYPDVLHANRKVQELNNRICAGRRVKLEMNTLPPGRFVPSFRPNSVKINNLASTVADQEVRDFAGSDLVRRLNGLSYNAEHAIRQLRHEVELLASGAMRTFDQTSTLDSVNGVISVRVQFTSWEEAQKVHDSLADRKIHYIGYSSFWLRLPSPLLYTVVISAEQYKAQKTQWASLIDSIKDRKACNLIVNEQANFVRIRLSGSVKQAIGSLKVRVETLIAGEQVEGWHSSLGYSRSMFVRSVFDETGAYMRGDWRRQVLKVYGEPRAVERARELIKAELERLSATEKTVSLKRQSVSFFIRHGIPALKETFGEDSVKFVASSSKITITGGEEVRHALSRLIEESLSELHTLPNQPLAEQACPICYDSISSPHYLGCGHVYCMACLRHFLTSAVDSDEFPLVCMGDEARCGVPIPIPTIQRFLPPASFNRLLEVVFNKHIAERPQELKYCKTPDCTQLYRAATQNIPASALQCPSCFSTVCSSCHEDAHEGMSCAEYRIQKDPTEQERLNDAWIAQQGGRVKKCPSCSVPIEKLEGCNHMSCRCGAHICWRCMGIFTADTIYPHMHAQHGGIHDDAEPALDFDYREQQELLRQVQARRAQQAQPFELDAQRRARALQLWDEEQQRRLQEDIERGRRMRLQIQEDRLREEQRRRAQEEQARQRRENERPQGWGCIIM